jgi:eukaryotic-like serine/threonine-protein kinase
MPDDATASTVPHDRFESALAELLQAEERGEPLDLVQVLRTCPDLGTPLREFFRDRDGFDRLAPQLGSMATRSVTMPPPGLLPGSRFGGYEIVGELGRGGMGIVYHARQLAPQREVALKVIRTDRLGDLPPGEARQWVERFQREAQVVASLEQHPNLVTLYEVGEHDGRPFFTMQLVRGGSLAAGSRQPQLGGAPQREAAKLVAAVARAVHHAHRHGVLHRDLKPGNILLDGEGRPLVSDFGLARRLDHSGSLVTGTIEGTAEYMPPEQAAGAKGALTTAADVYSLGAILYERFTGRPPFRGKNDVETLLEVMRSPPVPPRRLNPRLSRDLETICLKCLEKEPRLRYDSAAALADDLENFVAGRPIAARPISAVERLWRFCRRYPVPAAAALIVFVTLVTAVPVTLYSRDNALRLADEKDRLARSEETEKKNAQRFAGQRDAAAHEAETQRDANATQLALAALDQGHRSCRRGDLALGLLQFARAQQVAPADAQELRGAGRANLAAWRGQFRALLAMLPHDDEVLAVGFSPDGKVLLTGSRDEKARLWDAATGFPIGAPFVHLGRNPNLPAVSEKVGGRGGQVVAVALSPDGKTLATGTADPYHKGRAQVWEAGLLAVLRPMDDPLWNDKHDLAGFPAGGFGTRDFPAQIWEVGSGKLVRRPLDRQTVWAVAFSPDGKLLLTAEGRITGQSPSDMPRVPVPGGGRQFGHEQAEGSAELWQWADGKMIGSMRHDNAVLTVAFSPDGKRIATGSIDRTARLWEAGTGKPLCNPIKHGGPVTATAFSPDGRLLLTASFAGPEGVIRLWELATGGELGQFRRPGLPVLAATFSPDGCAILAGCGDPAAHKGEAVFWDVATGQMIGDPIPHPEPVQAVAYSPDGLRVLTACTDRVARLWEANIRPAAQPLARYEDALAFSADGRQVLRNGGDRQPRICAAADGAPTGPRLGPEKQTRDVYLSGDGRFAFSLWLGPDQHPLAGPLHMGRLWDTATGQALGSELKLANEIAAVAISPDGRRVLTSHVHPHVPGSYAQLWDVASGKAIGKPLCHNGAIRALAFSPDGRTAIVASDDHTARLCDGATGEPIGEVLTHNGPVRAVAFSSDGGTVVTGSDDYTARLWEAATGKPVGEALPMRGEIRAVAFSPNGRFVVTGSDGGTARLWETATRKPVGLLLEHDGPVSSVAFSPDSGLVLTGSVDRKARLWAAPTGGPVGVPLPHRGPVLAVCFGPDGRTGLTRSNDRAGAAVMLQRVGNRWERPVGNNWECTGYVWPLPAAPDATPEQVTRRAQALTGMALDSQSVLRPLELDAWEQCRKDVRDATLELPAEAPLAWHRREAAAAQARRQFFAARWHLDRLVAAEPEQASHRLSRCQALAALGELELALSDAAEAIELKREDYAGWSRRGEVQGLRGQWELAVQDFSEALNRETKNPAVWHLRGQAHAELGRWQDAAEDLRKAAELPGSYIEVQEHLALVCLAQHDPDGYRKTCDTLLGWLAQRGQWVTHYDYDPTHRIAGVTHQEGGVGTEMLFDYSGFGPVRTITQRGSEPRTEPLAPVAARLAWVCSIAPKAPSDKRAQSAAEEAVKFAAETVKFNDKEYTYARTLGAALYRTDRYEDAVKELTRALTLRKQPNPAVWLFLALAHQRCGHGDEAKESLNKARNWIAQARLRKSSDEAGPAWARLPWQERVALELLLAEAEKMIDAKPQKDPG